MHLSTLENFGRGLLSNMVEHDPTVTKYSSKRAVRAMVKHCPSGFVFSEGKTVQGFVLFQENRIHTLFAFANSTVPGVLAHMLAGCDGQLGPMHFWKIHGYNQNVEAEFEAARKAADAGP